MSLRLSTLGAAVALALSLSHSIALPAHADWDKVQQSGSLKVAVYTEFAPFSASDGGIDVDLGAALAKKLHLRLNLLAFPAGEELGDDLRNMVWKGHYMGFGPADVMLHVPVEPQLMAAQDKVQIFAPYHVESVQWARSAQALPVFDSLDTLAGLRIGAEKVSIASMVLLGEGNGRFREQVRIFPTGVAALEELKAGRLDAVLANSSEIAAVFRGDPAFPMTPAVFQRLPRNGWAVGMAVKKGNEDIALRLQAALNELRDSGELEAIFNKHGVPLVQP